MNFRKLITAYHQQSFFKKTSFFFLGLALVAGFHSREKSDEKSEKSQEPEIDSIDTIIPVGFVLVPVDLANQEALSSIVSDHAIIDLFSTASLSHKGGIRVGKKLRLIRAPLNPQKFAVLVPEDEANALMSLSGPLNAVIQNKNEKQMGGLEKPLRPHRIKSWN